MKTQLIVLAAAVAFAGVLAGIGTAGGHARLKESTPKVGEVLQASPTEVRITFSNDIQKIAGFYGIEVANEAGQSFTAGPTVIDEDDRSLMTVPLQPNLPPGRYVVTYKNVSDVDGDPFEGGFAFYVGVQPTAEQLAADALLEPPEASATQTFEAGTGASPVTGSPSGTAAASGEPTAAVSPSPGATSGTSDSGDNGRAPATLVFVGAGLVVAAILGFVIWRAARGARTGR